MSLMFVLTNKTFGRAPTGNFLTSFVPGNMLESHSTLRCHWASSPPTWWLKIKTWKALLSVRKIALLPLSAFKLVLQYMTSNCE